MDLRKFKVNCSDLGDLMSSNLKNKALTTRQEQEMLFYLSKEKELTAFQEFNFQKYVRKQLEYNPNILSAATKQMMVKMYCKFLYEKSTISKGADASFSILKGVNAENEAIKLLSSIDGVNYVKNETKFSNRYIKGYPDIVDYNVKKVIEIKISTDIVSFVNNHDSSLDKKYYYQMQGYLELTKIDYGEIVYCLVDAPQELIDYEIRKLKSKLYLRGYSDEMAAPLVERLYNNMVFDSVPYKRRIIRYKVHRNSDDIKSIYEKVKKCKTWISKLNKKHINERNRYGFSKDF
jgi:hypothetical protein